MNRMRALALTTLTLLAPGLLLTAALRANAKGPLPQLTAGFGEDSCVACHDSFELNEGRTRGGVFHLLGVPENYEPGQSYPITVLIGQPGQSRWGYELSARFVQSGLQAGQLAPFDAYSQVVEKAGIQYILHTQEGNRAGTSSGPVAFVFNWVAPQSAREPVLFNAAGNAADGSGDPKGDYIYTAGAYSGVTGVRLTGLPAPPSRRPESRSFDFSNRLVNLPTTRPIQRGMLEFLVAHRFTQPVFQGSLGQLLGLDSSANILFGFNFGLAKNVGLSVYRSRSYGTLDVAGEFSLLQQGSPRSPVSVLARAGVTGRDNFGLSPADFRPDEQRRHYSPYLQTSISRSFGNRLSLYAVPFALFNSRDEVELLFGPGFGVDHNHSFSIGLGGSLRLPLMPSVFLVGEYIPRIAGFRGVFQDRPAVSVGLQKNTRGHSFQLLLSTAPGLAPNEYSLEGTDTFRIGFNIYRRLKR